MNNDRAGRVYEFDGRRRFRVEPQRRLLTKDGEAVGLPLKAFDILVFLMENRDRVVSREEIITHAWGKENMNADQILQADRVLTTQINRLRDVLEDREKIIVVMVPRTGYRFGAEVLEISRDPGAHSDSPAKNRDLPPSVAPTRPGLGPYASVSPLPLYYVERQEALARLRELISGGNARTVAVTAVDGMGGIGKTELARALCHDVAIRAAFPDGIVWIEVGKNSGRTLVDLMKEVAEALNDDSSSYTGSNCLMRYRSLLSGKAVLIVLDNVWAKEDVEPFITDSPRCPVVFTTRDLRIAARLGAQNFSTNLLDDEQARNVLAKCSRRSLNELPGTAEEIIRECGNLPLGLREIGSSLRGKPDDSWLDILDKLRNAQVTRVYAPTKVSLDVLGEEYPTGRHRYLQLAVLLEDMVASVPILRALWGVDEITTRDTIDELENRCLVRREASGIRLHDLQMDYVRSEYLDKHALELIHQSIRLSSHVVRHDPTQFSSQVVGRLLPYQDDKNIGTFLKSIRDGSPRPSLHPLAPCLTPPGRGLVGVLQGHRGIVRGVAMSADGRITVSAGDDGQLKIWDVRSAQELRTIDSHGDAVLQVAMTADERVAASASADHTLKIWEVASGRCHATLNGHTDKVTAVAVSSNGRIAVSASRDGTVKQWDVTKGREIRTLHNENFVVTCVAVSWDGRIAISGDIALRVWDMATGRGLHALNGHSSSIFGVALSEDAKVAVSASADCTLRVWDIVYGRHVRTLTGHSDCITCVALSADGNIAVSGSIDQTLKVWDVISGQELRTLTGHAAQIESVAISADGTVAVSASADGGLRVWKLPIDEEHPATTTRLTLPPRGVFAWTLRSLRVRQQTGRGGPRTMERRCFVAPDARGLVRETHSKGINGVALSADGKVAVSACSDHTVGVWDANTGQRLRTLVGHSDCVNSVALSPDGRLTISASADRTLMVWDVLSGRRLHMLIGHDYSVNGVALGADGKVALSASADHLLKSWRVAAGRHLCTFHGHGASVNGVALSADGKVAVSASNDQTLNVWDVVSGRRLRRIIEEPGQIDSVALSADGLMAISSFEETIKVWEVATGRHLRTLIGHTKGIKGLCVSPDGALAVSASEDHTVKLWNLRRGRCAATFTCDAPAFSCAWGGSVIAAGDEAGNIHFLALKPFE